MSQSASTWQTEPVSEEERALAYYRAVTALTSLGHTDAMRGAYAEALKSRLLPEYKSWRGVKEYRGPNYLHRLVGTRAVYRPSHRWIDHQSMWTKDGKPYSFVSQPYVLTLDALEEIVRYCRENALDLWIDAERSWYYPGHTLLVEIRRREGK